MPTCYDEFKLLVIRHREGWEFAKGMLMALLLADKINAAQHREWWGRAAEDFNVSEYDQ